jgi:hypothetical protein
VSFAALEAQGEHIAGLHTRGIDFNGILSLEDVGDEVDVDGGGGGDEGARLEIDVDFGCFELVVEFEVNNSIGWEYQLGDKTFGNAVCAC